MDTRKILSALSYFSIFFAGFIIPIIIYFVSDDGYVRHHAKKALISHIVPFASLLFLLFAVIVIPTFSGFAAVIILTIVLYFGVMIYNVVKGIQVLLER